MKVNPNFTKNLNFTRIIYSDDKYTQNYLSSLTREEKDVFRRQMDTIDEKTGKKNVRFFVSPFAFNFSLNGKQVYEMPLESENLVQDFTQDKTKDIINCIIKSDK